MSEEFLQNGQGASFFQSIHGEAMAKGVDGHLWDSHASENFLEEFPNTDPGHIEFLGGVGIPVWVEEDFT